MARHRLLDVENLRAALSTVRPTGSGWPLSHRRAAANWVEAVPGVSFGVDPGEVLAIIGESACGKSLVLLGAFGLLSPGARVLDGRTTYGNHTFEPAVTPPIQGRPSPRKRRRATRNELTAGTVLAAGHDPEWLRLLGTEVGFLFQDPVAAWTPVYTIGDQSGEALDEHSDLTQEEIDQRVLDALGEVRLPRSGWFFGAFREEMSRGQAQRAMLAAALTKAPRLLIADEPLTGLDAPVAAAILDLIADLRSRRRMGMVIVTHDLAVVARIADRVAVLYAGRIVEEAATAEVFRHPKHPYTSGLLRSIPAFSRGRLEPIPGEAPDLTEVPPGLCPFVDRCAHAVELCRRSEPELRRVGAAAVACHLASELHLEGVSGD